VVFKEGVVGSGNVWGRLSPVRPSRLEQLLRSVIGAMAELEDGSCCDSPS
jgi:hypothetical protein